MNTRHVHQSDWRQSLADLSVALGLALLVHLAVAGLLWVGAMNWQPRKPPPVASFTLVDATPFVEAERQQRLSEDQERLAEQQAREAEQRLEQTRREEELRRAELERQRREGREQQQRQQVLEQQRQEQLRLEAERNRQVEQQRALDRARRAAEQERLRELEDLRRQRDQAERERREQEQRLAELADRREQKRREAEAAAEAERLRLARAQAENQQRRATLGEEYVSTIAELVRRNWIRPVTTRAGISCSVRVVQIPGGEIIDQAIVNPCNADDVTRRSILSAVERTAVLPYRGYEDVFEPEIQFNFTYDGP